MECLYLYLYFLFEEKMKISLPQGKRNTTGPKLTTLSQGLHESGALRVEENHLSKHN